MNNAPAIDVAQFRDIQRRRAAGKAISADDCAIEVRAKAAVTDLEVLAALDPVEYDRTRETAAEALGIRVSTLDVEISRLRRNGIPEDAQGQGILPDDPEPWPEPVDGAELLEAVAETFKRYLALPAKAETALALWTLHAHCFEAFVHTPRLNVTAPEKGCGKTLLLDVLQALTPKALRTENVTPAVLFRLIDEHVSTLLVDEYDSFLKGDEELRGALNAGHRRGGRHLRCVGDSNEVRAFKTFAPVALAGIRELPGTLRDRSILIRMNRAKPGEIRERFDSRRIERETTLKRKLARFAADHIGALAEIEPELPCELFNREADNWRPLAAIAEVVGNGWPEKLHGAIHALRDKDSAEESSTGAMLLADMSDLFCRLGADWIASANICEHLAALESRPWPEWGRAQKPITPRQLARALGAFGIKPKPARREGVTAGTRGYFRGDFEDTFGRYLSPSATPQQATPDGAFSDSRSATGPDAVADRESREPAPGGHCCTVADGETRAGAYGRFEV